MSEDRNIEGRRLTGRVIASLNRAGGMPEKKSGFTGQRQGRGGAIASLLALRGETAAFLKRRVIVKVRMVKTKNAKPATLAKQLIYLRRSTASREGRAGSFYNADCEALDGRKFIECAEADRHHFRLIISPEDSTAYNDFRTFIRAIMTQVEIDLETALDWIAIDHFDTDHSHVHILVRGVDGGGRDLIISPAYLGYGIRERACEQVLMDLGLPDAGTLTRRQETPTQHVMTRLFEKAKS